MGFNKKIFLLVFLFFCSFITVTISKKVLIGDKDVNVINISNLSETFMDDYFEKYSKIVTSEEKTNILIVTSTKKIDKGYGATNVIAAPNNQYVLQFDSAEKKMEALDQLEKNSSVLSVDENQKMDLYETTYNSWGIAAMGLNNTIASINPANLSEVHVAVVDTGCDVNLVNKYYAGKISESYNALNQSSTVSDVNGHGTHITGTIAEGTPANVKIIPVKASSGSELWTTDIIAGINYIVYYEKADVLNMSFGSSIYTDSLYTAIESANQKGIITVAASGNDNSPSKSYPAAFDNTISISSVDFNLKKSSFSNYGSTIDFAAPGSNIKSTLSKNMTLSGNTDGDDDFEAISGTSMATPHAANAVAILKSYNKNLMKDDVVDLLKNYAVKDLGEIGKDKYYGNGFIYFNSASFCSGPSDDCETFRVFKKQAKISATNIQVSAVVRTDLNYATVNNFHMTEMKVTLSNGDEAIVKLGDLSDVEISGYDPEMVGEQTIVVRWEGLETSFKFTNPENWDSGWNYVLLDNNKIKLTGFQKFNTNSSAKKLYIPAKVDGYDVVEIANNSYGKSIFADDAMSTYEEIILPSTLTEISGNDTFKGFTAVEKVSNGSNSLRITGENVFANNTNLVEFTGSIAQLSKNTFANDVSLQAISLADDITDIPYGAFYACQSLTDINFSSNLKSVGFKAFQDTGLWRVNLPNSVEVIDDYAFYQSEEGSIMLISLSSSLKTIGKYAFSGTLIENVVLPASLESIGNAAFANSINLSEFSLPKNVTSVGNDLLINCPSLETITVDTKNAFYDSRNNSNAIIETSTNTLLSGSSNTVVPTTVKKIAKNAFCGITISELSLPQGVNEIGEHAFYNSTMESVVVPSSVEAIGTDAFIGKDNNKITIWLDTTSYVKSYAVTNEIPYEGINVSYVSISLESLSFSAFDTVSTDAYIYFDRGVNSLSGYTELKKYRGRKETIKAENLEIVYPNNHDSLQYGDASFVVKGRTQYGENFEKEFNVTVSKLVPNYTIPSGVTANTGQKLSEIELPSGFEWTYPETVVAEAGNFVYKARYVPSDTQNYEIIENIDIPVMVNLVKSVIVPNITVNNKTYDGTLNIPSANIVVSNLLTSEYTVVSATLSNANVGNRTATIKLRLTDDKFSHYTFENGKQEMEFNKVVDIIPKRITKPSQVINNYVYTGSEINFELLNYDQNVMTISNNKGVNVGEYQVTVHLKNSNYLWNDGKDDDIYFDFEICKANLVVNDLSSNVTIKYDGNLHGISVNLQSDFSLIIKYMDEDGDYILDEAPKYRDVGTYDIKYKAYVNNNYTEYFGQKRLIIEDNIFTYVINDYAVDEINKYISKIIVNTEDASFKEHIDLNTGYSVDVETKVINDKKVLYTGGKTKILKNAEVYFEYTNAVVGDINGDGAINSADLLKIRQHLLGTNILTGIYFLASDINYDNQINSADLLRVRQHLLGSKLIQ